MSKSWKKRQEVPNTHILDSADQYKRAWEHLSKQPPGSGVVLPKINMLAMAIELYLKCLSSEMIYTDDKEMSGISIVTANPEQRRHELVEILKKIPAEHLQEIEKLYKSRMPEDKRTFLEVIIPLEKAFMASRYPFDKDFDITKYSLNDLKSVCIILHDYTAGLEVKETITW